MRESVNAQERENPGGLCLGHLNVFPEKSLKSRDDWLVVWTQGKGLKSRLQPTKLERD